jgi:hypothetical protein
LSSTTHPGQDFNRLYADISASIGSAIADIAELNVNHEAGKREIGNMLQRLRTIQSRFDNQLTDLQKFAEWEKFTLAFFGETNAGKSTIIESLRILFEEESRRQLLQDEACDVERFEQALRHHVKQVQDGMSRVCHEYASEMNELRQSASTLARVQQSELSARVRRKVCLAATSGVIAGCVLAASLSFLLRGFL